MPGVPGIGRYAFIAYTEQWPQIIEEISRAEPHLRAVGRPEAANLLLNAYGQLRDDLQQLGAQAAVAGTLTLRQMERMTRKRPDTGGGGGSRLEDALYVREVNAGGLFPGSIGIADLDVLDARVEWWWTQEIGYSGHVGRRIYGTFYGGAGAGPPDPGQFRQHPLFQPEHPVFRADTASGLAGFGVIERPIEARRFIEASVKVIDRDWREKFETIRGRFESRLQTVARTMR